MLGVFGVRIGSTKGFCKVEHRLVEGSGSASLEGLRFRT